MNFTDLWSRLFGQKQPHPLLAPPINQSCNFPSTLQAERRNPLLNRPIVFDPALWQFIAHRAGEPHFDSDQAAQKWHACRMSVLHHILDEISRSKWSESLVLRGSVLMVAWLANQPRQPGDLDWVVTPESLKLQMEPSRKLVEGLISLLGGTTVSDHLLIPRNAFATEEIWMYEKAPGIRMIVPWQHQDSQFDGTIQMDLVFGELMPSPPINSTLRLGELPPLQLRTASPEQSLAWKLLWLISDSYAMGKDLYDAVLLAEAFHVSTNTVLATFQSSEQSMPWMLKEFNRQQIIGLHIEWDDFLKEYPAVPGTVEEWKHRLADALTPLFTDIENQYA
ncbi:MAG: hypothetical protein C0478_13095 [Planctomyces sp.]|nr:hypothetical protein [Planctomyces sp.]